MEAAQTALAQHEYLARHWKGAVKGNGEPLAADHDEYLYGDR